MQATELNPELPTVGGWENTERSLLEEMLGRECGCEVWHTPGSCTVKVVARGIACNATVKMCENGRQWHVDHMERGTVCGACKRKAADCWRIIPI